MHSINFYTPNGLKKLTLKLILLVAFSGILVNNAFSQGTASITGSGSVLTVSANSASVVDPDIVVTTSSDLTGCKVSITGGYVPGSTGDILDIQGSLPTGITQSYDNTRGILSFSGTAAASVWQELLRRVTLKSTSLSCYPEQRSVTFNLGASFLNPLTGHWYEFDATPRNWKAAKAYAATKSYNGRVGYLATITSAAENNYIWKIMASDAWVGGSDDYLEINAALGRDVYANQAAAEGKYYWVTGPEKGMQFTEGNINPVTLTGAYANWNSREPNNSGSEHYTQLYSGNLGRWNDLNINPQLGTLIEYGDSPDDNVSNTVGFTKEIKVLGAASGSITGGNINVCTGSNSTTLTLVGNSGAVVQWESSFDNFYTTGTTINNTTNTYTATNVSQTTYYRAIVSCGGGTVYTASVTLTVNATASGNVTAQNNSICAGGEVNLTLSGKKGDVVKWQISTDNSNWTDIANTTTNLIETLTTAGTYYYRAVVETAGCGAAVNSTAYPITVTSGTPPVGGTMSAVTYYDSTPRSGTLTLSGYTGTISKWQSSTNGGINWTDISNTAATYSYSNISTTTLYRAVLINGSCGTAYSSRGGITFSAMPVITSFSPSTAGIGETVTITGTNFTNIISVSFGGTAASSFTVVSDTKIEAVVGAGSSGSVRISNSDAIGFALPGFTFIIRDFDGDGILDATDTDDDNDGIPDTDELDCSASTGVSNTVDPSPFYFVQWNSYVNGELKGTIDVAGTIVNVTVTNSSNSILQYRDNPYGGTAHWGPTPTGNPFNSTFRSSTLGEHKFVFDRPVNNPRFFINSLNKTLDLSQPGVILKSNGAFVGTPTGSTTSTLVGSEANGTISFNGNLTQVSFTGREYEFYCNFSLGLSSIADYSSCVDKDTDGDGLVDRLDIESDGDGVTDAQELADGTDYTDPCSFVLANQTLTPDAAWNAADCDADGDTNETEKTNGTNPLVFDTLPQITGPDGTGTTTAATSALDYAENATTSIYTFTSNRSVTWSLDGGEDSAKFSINATSGALTFASSPDFETPTDGSVSGSNTYTVVIKAVDNRNLGNRQTLTVTITNVNEAPSITSIAPQSVLGTDPTSDLAFTVSDPESEAANLLVSVASSNTTLVPTSNIVVTGTGANRTVRVSAADGLYGTANITLTVTDELGLSTSTTFALTVQNASCNTFTVSDFQLNGNSSVAGNIITLTPNAGAQSGSAWNKNKLILSEDFNISAKVYLGNNDAGADGIAFVLQNQSVNAGSSGGGLGYSGITPSFAVEFDTFYNGGNDPGSQDHIAIIKNGQTSLAAAHSEFATPYYVQMEDGQWHDVQFVWTAQTKNFQVWYDGTKRFDIVYDIKANIFPSQNYAYWGFTGATGGAINLQQVQIPEYCYAKQATITPTAGTNNASGATTFCYGSDVVLQASTATSYQWYKNGALISGANLREFTASQTGSYTVEVVSTRGGITSVSEPTIVAVNPVPVIFYAQSSYSFIRGNVLSPIVVSNTGAGSTNFTISPSLPAGLTFNASNGTISGTPTAISDVQNYTVSASSAAACQASTVVSIRVYNDNPPANLTYTPSTQTLRRNTPMNNMVPTATGGAVISYSISPNLPAGLSINPTTGVISGTLTAALTGSQTYTVTATNSGGSTTATITLIFNSPPTDIIPSSSSIAENNAIGAVIGRLSSTDVDLGDTHTYRLVAGTGSTDNARFSIVGNELKALISFNFENKTSYTIRIRTTDAGGLSFEKAISIAITNVNEVPTDWAISASNINENNAIGAVIGRLSSTDVDAGDTFTYRLVSGIGSTDNGKFTIVGNELKADISFNFEAKKTYSVRIRTTDAGGLSFEKEITIRINDVNEAPTNITLSRSYIYESNEIGVDIGVLNTADVDARDTHRYSLVGGDVNAFSILDNQLKAAISYNSANKNTYSVVLRTTDLGGLSFDKTFTITILKTPVVTGTGNITGSLVRTAPSSNPSISKGLTSQLNVAGMAIVNYRWSPSLSLSANNIANPVASPGKTTTYTVTVTHSSGAVCTLTIPVLVLNDYNVTPGNIITPNGDGINDAWVVENLESYPENEVKIFDKAGRLIYGKKGYTNDWRAEVNGSLLTEDTYYYFISFGPGVPVKKGFITIIRN